jgi:hypothetical protein
MSEEAKKKCQRGTQMIRLREHSCRRCRAGSFSIAIPFTVSHSARLQYYKPTVRPAMTQNILNYHLQHMHIGSLPLVQRNLNKTPWHCPHHVYTDTGKICDRQGKFSQDFSRRRSRISSCLRCNASTFSSVVASYSTVT